MYNLKIICDMKNSLKILWTVISMLWLLSSCSEKEPVIDHNITQPFFKVLDGPPGSLGAVAREYYDRWGSIVVYEYTDLDIRWSWTGWGWLNWYVPPQPNTEHYAKELLSFLRDNLFGRFPEEFMRKILPYTIFLVDSLSASPLPADMGGVIEDVIQVQNRLILANVRPGIDTLPESRWNQIRLNTEGAVMQGIYNASPRPVTFFNLRWNAANEAALVPDLGEDPLGVITANISADNAARYSHNVAGFVRGWIQVINGREGFRQPTEEADFVDFTLFLIQNSASWIDYMLRRFDRLRVRAIELELFLRTVVGLDVIATQHLNNPDDSLPHDFFQRMARL